MIVSLPDEFYSLHSRQRELVTSNAELMHRLKLMTPRVTALECRDLMDQVIESLSAAHTENECLLRDIQQQLTEWEQEASQFNVRS
ncbi:hypothetical protein PX52LOC_07620 [Limnoglobus roseus]|uniref:Uncharacterized protein n=1 Tax=Limnoglobus roseus TaxID=2598579 RepID=A0A5C1ARB1_9BACT|nr:hypothetical protein PX52LOC_07620 [Limnoglobus roseus]